MWKTIVLFVVLILSVLSILSILSPRRRMGVSEHYTDEVEIIHLVLYSPTFPYEDMRQATLPLYQLQAPRVATWYYCYTEGISDVRWDDQTRILHLPGKETYVPGILDKTVDAVRHALRRYPNARLVVRSNASTVLDLPEMLHEVGDLGNLSVDYGGYMLNTLAWLDPAGGVVDETWWGTQYASGTCILLSRARADALLQEASFLRRNLVDDLCIGVWMREHHPEVKMWSSSGKGWMNRHRQASRAKDVEAVKECVARLMTRK